MKPADPFCGLFAPREATCGLRATPCPLRVRKRTISAFSAIVPRAVQCTPRRPKAAHLLRTVHSPASGPEDFAGAWHYPFTNFMLHPLKRDQAHACHPESECPWLGHSGYRTRSTIFPIRCPASRRLCASAASARGYSAAIGTPSFVASTALFRCSNSAVPEMKL